MCMDVPETGIRGSKMRASEAELEDAVGAMLAIKMLDCNHLMLCLNRAIRCGCLIVLLGHHSPLPA